MKKITYFLMIPIIFLFVACDNEDDMNDVEQMNPTLVEAAQSAGLTTLLDAVGAVEGLDAELLSADEITVFAPNNAAFNAALEAFNVSDLNGLIEAVGGVDQLETVLKYHVVADAIFSADLTEEQTVNTLAGGSLTINSSGSAVTITDGAGQTFNVVTADVAIDNGVVHVIEGVLLPNAPEAPKPNLVEAATSAGLTTLLDAVNAVDGLGNTLLNAEAITVFAPTNDAFDDALELYGVTDLTGLVEAIGGENTLEILLQYHVIGSTALSSDLTDGQMLTTLAGEMLEVSIGGGTVSLTDAAGRTFTVTTADVAIENGVVHVIDGVLIPDAELLPKPTLVEAATDAGLTTLLDAVTAVDGLAETLLGSEAITVFAPTNDAFADALETFGVTNLNDLVTELGGIEQLELVLGFHVVPAVAFAEDLNDGAQTFTTLGNQDITVTKTADGVTVTDATGTVSKVSIADVAIENGVVHVIDGVLLPDLNLPSIVDAATAAGLTTLLDAVTAAELGATLTGADAITVFAPTNDAFGGLLERYDATDLNDLVAKIGIDAVTEVLTFHVVPAVAFSHDLSEGEQSFTTLQGQELTVTKNANGVFVTDYFGFTYQVSTANVAIENGVVHLIEGVVIPDLSEEPNIVEAATSAGLNTLLDAVVAAELDDDLQQATEITVFAPSNAAFTDLLEAQEVSDLAGLIDKLGAEAVTKVLQFHVVPTVAFAADLEEGEQTVPTLAGENLTVNKTAGVVTVTDAAGNTFTVTTADVTIENGVVHVIDGVLLPTL